MHIISQHALTKNKNKLSHHCELQYIYTCMYIICKKKNVEIPKEMSVRKL